MIRQMVLIEVLVLVLVLLCGNHFVLMDFQLVGHSHLVGTSLIVVEKRYWAGQQAYMTEHVQALHQM